MDDLGDVFGVVGGEVVILVLGEDGDLGGVGEGEFEEFEEEGGGV